MYVNRGKGLNLAYAFSYLLTLPSNGCLTLTVIGAEIEIAPGGESRVMTTPVGAEPLPFVRRGEFCDGGRDYLGLWESYSMTMTYRS